MKIDKYLKIDEAAEAICCLDCGERLHEKAENYKEHTVLKRADVANPGPRFRPPMRSLGDPGPKLRRCYCPSCGTVLDHRDTKRDDDIYLTASSGSDE